METSQPNLTSIVGDKADDSLYREAPHNVEAEQALLGAILTNNEAMNRVSGFLTAEHFYEPVHGRIFAAALAMVERGQIANPVTLKTYFEADGALSDIGGAQYLARLAGAAVTIINAGHYGRAIFDLAMRRALIDVGEAMVNTAYDSPYDVSAEEQIEAAEHKLFRLAEDGRPEGGFKSLEHSLADAVGMMEAAYKRESGVTGVATGLTDLDELLGGLHASDLIILAGRPSMGKTALATNIAFNAARSYAEEFDETGETRVLDGAKVAFFSLEMSAEQLATRIVSEVAGLDSERLRRGKMNKDEFLRVVQAAQELSAVPFFIDDTPALSVAALRTRARRLKRTQGLDLIVVDYLQLMRGTGPSRTDNRVQEISEITQGLKALAKELGLPVLALSQLSRAVEQRDNKRPQLSDLRESGAIEQDADVVSFIYRQEYYLRREEPQQRLEEKDDQFNERYTRWKEKFETAANLAEVIIAKQRHGPVGHVNLRFEHQTTKFDNLVEDDHIPDVPF